MPAQEETAGVVVTTWVLNDLEDVREFEQAMFDLDLDVTTYRHPAAPGPQQMRMQVDIPDKPRDPILIDGFGDSVRAITMGDTLISLEKVV